MSDSAQLSAFSAALDIARAQREQAATAVDRSHLSALGRSSHGGARVQGSVDQMVAPAPVAQVATPRALTAAAIDLIA